MNPDEYAHGQFDDTMVKPTLNEIPAQNYCRKHSGLKVVGDKNWQEVVEWREDCQCNSLTRSKICPNCEAKNESYYPGDSCQACGGTMA